MKYKKKATIINNGDYQIRTHNGNKGFVGHEDYDQNVNLIEADALDKCKGDNVIDIYYNRPHKKRLFKRHVKKKPQGVDWNR